MSENPIINYKTSSGKMVQHAYDDEGNEYHRIVDELGNEGKWKSPDREVSSIKEDISSIINNSTIDPFMLYRGGLPEYLLPTYNSTLEKILPIDRSNHLLINYITDLHYQSILNSGSSIGHGESSIIASSYVLLHGLLSRYVHLSVNNGDLIEGRTSLDRCRSDIKSLKSLMDKYYSDVLHNLGNHEDGNCFKTPKIEGNYLTLDELTDIYGIDSFNQKKDYDDHKVRVVLLGIYDNPEVIEEGVSLYPRDTYSIITPSLLDFLLESLITLPEDYSIILFTHDNPSVTDSSTRVNHGALNSMLTMFQNSSSGIIESSADRYSYSKNVDFTNKPKNRLIGIISGHRHTDIYSNSRGWHDITRACQVCSTPSNSSIPDRILGTDTEVVVDILDIDSSSRTIKIHRIGPGSSLELSY